MGSCHIWIFDIGRGFASVIRTPANRWIMIDLGTNDEFNPVTNFMVPGFKNLRIEKRPDNRYQISQLIITHPHDDHLSAIRDFNQTLYPTLLTVPNDVNHPDQPEGSKINWDLITNPTSDLTDYLRKEMLPGEHLHYELQKKTILRVLYLKFIIFSLLCVRMIKNF